MCFSGSTDDTGGAGIGGLGGADGGEGEACCITLENALIPSCRLALEMAPLRLRCIRYAIHPYSAGALDTPYTPNSFFIQIKYILYLIHFFSQQILSISLEN